MLAKLSSAHVSVSALVLLLTDDIIRLNKREQQIKRRLATVNRRPVKKKGKTAGPGQRGVCVLMLIVSLLLLLFCTCVTFLMLSLPGGGVPKLRNRRVPPLPARRRGQGVITGLAARRPAALLKRVGTLNRAAINQVMEDIHTRTGTWCLITDSSPKPHCRLLAALAVIHRCYCGIMILIKLNK